MSEEKCVKDISIVEELQQLQAACDKSYRDYLDAKRKNKTDIKALRDLWKKAMFSNINSNKKPIHVIIDLYDAHYIKIRNDIMSELGHIADYFISEPLSLCPLYNYTLLATYYSFKGYIPKLDLPEKRSQCNYPFKCGHHNCCDWCEVTTTHTEWMFHEPVSNVWMVEFIYYNSDMRLYSLFPSEDYKMISTSARYLYKKYNVDNRCLFDLYYKPILTDGVIIKPDKDVTTIPKKEYKSDYQ
jgi:hypothetical protein